MTSNAPQKEVLKLSQETESLVRRLAGPSSGKAGLAKDQTEINRIISDVSKGSKFYENEKKKDKELTARIEKILKQKEEAVKGVDLARIELTVDHLVRVLPSPPSAVFSPSDLFFKLEQIEAQRDLTQIIVHVDMDAFYANVELLDNPELKGKPFGVGRGVLTTASYDARKYGVRSGMAAFVAKKLCPELILVKNRFWRYSEMSEKIMEIFHRYDPEMCPAGCDEGYLNITAYCEEHLLSAEECVQQMRETVFKESQLTVSAGIAPNKMLAKICSDKNKPNGQFQLQFDVESIKAFMHDLSIRKVPGIGRVNERLLEAIGIKTCGDVYTQRAVLSLMDKQFGLVFLLRTYLGIASNVVQAHRREERKSIGAERTFAPLDDLERIFDKLTEIATELEKDMDENGWTGRTVALKFKLDTYQVFTRAKSIDHWVSKKEELFAIGKELLLPETPLKLRLIGLRVTKLKDLRAAASSTNGIKRFFDSVKEDGSRKKAKLAELDGALDENMPGFHEHDEADHGMEDDDLEIDEIVNLTEPSDHGAGSDQPPTSRRGRPPHSTKNAQASSSKSETPTVRRRNSEAAPSSRKGEHETLKSRLKPETHECPICGKTLETDNDGLNAHVDFCLSRGAIMEAQVEASRTKPIKPESKTFKGWPKPPELGSKGKPLSKGKAAPGRKK